VKNQVNYPMTPQDNRNDNRKSPEEPLLSSVGTSLWQTLQHYANLTQLEPLLNKVVNWYNSLPTPGKVAVLAIALLFGLSLLQTLFQLVTSLIGLAILGGILYLVYKFFMTSQSSQ
jgi:hypothetical protein